MLCRSPELAWGGEFGDSAVVVVPVRYLAPSMVAMRHGRPVHLWWGPSKGSSVLNTEHYIAGRRVVTAVLRAGVAWSRRHEEGRAWGELSRMHGVVLGNLPIGFGPSTPGEMVDLLTKPLRSWLAIDWECLPTALGDLVVIDDGELTDEAFDIGASYLEALFDPVSGGLDGGRDWLPSWAWQTAEQTERTVYKQLAGGSQENYAAGRLMLVEVVAGTHEALLREYDQRRAPRMDVYVPLPPERVWSAEGTTWWWPCPDCRYPMRLAGSELRCDFLPHRRTGRFVLTASSDSARPPRVLNARATVKPERAEGVLCLEWSVWRHMTVPGLTEVALMRWLEGKGAEVKAWEEMDAWDIGVTLPDGWTCHIDVKDRADSRDIVAKPPRAEYIVVPSYRVDQVAEIRRGLDRDRYTVCTVARFKALITSRLGGGLR